MGAELGDMIKILPVQEIRQLDIPIKVESVFHI
jgi:hypothetical protein